MSQIDKKEFIEQLQQEKSDYNSSSQAEDLANALDTLSDDIYSENERFIYELIQNADDAYDLSGKGVNILIEFTSNFIILSHTGKEFTEKDIRAICGVGSSQKSKDTNKTGYKGIGFKSVFGKSDYVCINGT
jgi:HSP90 family molecular chaperone